MADAGRVPDLIIVGAMKSASTSLHRWLNDQPEVYMAHPKETNFFTTSWSRGLAWYSAQFAEAAPGQLLGESSVNYTNPELSPRAAERMSEIVPGARLIYVLRHPVERIRSHYRHEVQRRRESRPLLEALREPGNSYVAHSSYHTAFLPYVERFARDRLLVVRFEDLVRDPAPAWPVVLEFLGLADRSVPNDAHNVSAEKAQWTWAMSFAKRKGLITFGQISRLPAPVRRVGRKIFARGGEAYERKLDESRVPIPAGVLDEMWKDIARLESWLGSPLWSPDDRPVSGAAR
jgi:hypothetical protein